MDIKSDISILVSSFLEKNFNLITDDIEIQNTKKEFTGDLTVVLFPFYKLIEKNQIPSFAKDLGGSLVSKSEKIDSFNIVGGFLNLIVSDKFYLDFINSIKDDINYGKSKAVEETFIIEFSSPNTNKPLHLGHIRNNLLGYSVSKILEANGKNVKKVQIINDRGIHICKSMVAWKQYGEGKTPESENIKGDKFVGEYYILFNKIHNEQKKQLIDSGEDKDKAEENTQIMLDAKHELKNWEKNDKETLKVWKMMNEWVYEGFESTYNLLGVSFDKNYYESQTYLLGKDIIKDGLNNNIFYKKDDSSVWIDQRISDNENVKGMIYTVGNEQDYHFNVLFKILKKLGYDWASYLSHLSYGMVDLPSGKMKSREGTVVDADDLIFELIQNVKETTENLDKFKSNKDALDYEDYKSIALGALKYYILKVDPKKNILFNPNESIDLNGNTGPFIQYAYVRIQSIIKKYNNEILINNSYSLNEKEKEVIKIIYDLPVVVKNSSNELSPALIANYLYDLVKSYNSLYQNFNILNSESKESTSVRLLISLKTRDIIKLCSELLGIDLPNKM